MFEVPEYVKQRCRGDAPREECIRHLNMAFFSSEIDTLYPSNELFPSDSLFPADAGAPWLEIDLTQVQVESLILTESLCSSKDIVLGSCEAAKLEITMAEVEEKLEGNLLLRWLLVIIRWLLGCIPLTVLFARQIGE